MLIHAPRRVPLALRLMLSRLKDEPLGWVGLSQHLSSLNHMVHQRLEMQLRPYRTMENQFS